MNPKERILRILALAPAAFLSLGGGAWNLVKAIPTFIALARQILGLLHDVSDYVERRKKLKELHDAISVARKGDPSKLNALFGGGSEPPANP